MQQDESSHDANAGRKAYEAAERALKEPVTEAQDRMPAHASAVDALRAEIASLKHALDHERKARASVEERLAWEVTFTEERIKSHLSYRLGKEIVTSGRSPLAWIDLPWRLLRAYRNFQQDKENASEKRTKPASGGLIKLYRRHGAEGVADQIRLASDATPEKLGRDLVRSGQALAQAGEESAELALTAEAVRAFPSTFTLRARFWACHRASDYSGAVEAAEQLWEMAEKQEIGSEEWAGLKRIFRHPIRQVAVLNLIRPRSEPLIQPAHGRLCYILHNSLPYSSGGYATRSHGLASALIEAGWDVVGLTRPGFPLDVTSDLSAEEVPSRDQVERVNYVRLQEPSRRGLAATQYIELAAGAIEAELLRQRPEVVVAASNHLTGLPALIAARRLGIPFFYEVRGLWEITRLSREPAFANHVNFWIQKSLEAAVAKEAEEVFTLTEAMREELEARGIPGFKITLLPNSCDVEQFAPRERCRKLQKDLSIPEDVPVIGYVGTFVGYEGLDDLAQACGLLKQQGSEFRLLLVGNEDASGSTRGEITQAIEHYARQHGFLDWLIMPGRIPHELVPDYYSLIDITPFPRKPLPVCEMVSPIKPLEALAMEKSVLVSDVRALAEMVRDGETGLLFGKGDVQDLAAKLALLLEDRALRERLGRKGRQWVQQERSWRGAAERMSAKIAKHCRPASV